MKCEGQSTANGRSHTRDCYVMTSDDINCMLTLAFQCHCVITHSLCELSVRFVIILIKLDTIRTLVHTIYHAHQSSMKYKNLKCVPFAGKMH